MPALQLSTSSTLHPNRQDYAVFRVKRARQPVRIRSRLYPGDRSHTANATVYRKFHFTALSPKRLMRKRVDNLTSKRTSLQRQAFLLLKCGPALLLRHRVVELCVVEQQTTLRRNARDVLVTMVPADIAPGIDATRVELLGGAIIVSAHIEH